MKSSTLYLGYGVLLWLVMLVGWQLAGHLWSTREQALRQDVAAQQQLVRAAMSISCTSCHKLGSRTHLVGPHLVDLFGRPAGSLGDFAYSDAMKRSGLVWTRAQLRAFLLDPQRVVPGTAMAVSVPEADVDAVLDYLEAVR